MAINAPDNTGLGPKALGDINYEYDWFSGSQINIMIGDILIDSAVGISFSVQQSRTPVWGYANQYYTFLANGKVLVQGTLTIAFKESGYLLWPLANFMEKTFDETATSPRVTENGETFGPRWPLLPDQSSPLTAATKAAANQKVMRMAVENAVEYRHSDNPRAIRVLNQFNRDLRAVDDTDFERWAEVFEDAIWHGADRSNPFVRDRLFSKNIPENTKVDDEGILQHRRADQYPAVDIYIVYGDMSRQQPNHTVKQILDVSFTGQAQTIEISGQPTFEQYEFIARNVV